MTAAQLQKLRPDGYGTMVAPLLRGETNRPSHLERTMPLGSRPALTLLQRMVGCCEALLCEVGLLVRCVGKCGL